MHELDIDVPRPSPSTKTGFWSGRWKLVALLLLVLGGLVGIMAWGMLQQESVTGRSGVTRIGKPAPDFILETFSGDRVQLSDYRGRPVVVNFWASWCVPCRVEAPVLEQTWRKFKDKGVVFMGIDIQDSREQALDFIDEFGLTYPNGPDDGGQIAIDYGVAGIPLTFFINREGIVARRFVGAIKESQLVAWTEDLVSGVNPSGEVEAENLQDYRELEESQQGDTK